jgi:O-antigen/teichoic acid export membrane protein
MGGSVLRGGAWQSASRVLGQGYTLVVSIVAARYLGAAGMGRLVFITYVYTTIVALLSAGLPIAVNRFTAELLGSGRPDAIRSLYVWARRIEAGAAALGGGILVTVFLAGAEPRGAWLAAAVACSASALHTIPNAILLGARRWRQASLVGVASGIIGAAVKLVLLAAGQGIAALVAVDACVALANLAVASWLARGTVGQRHDVAPPSDLIPRAARYAAASTLAVVLGLVVLQRSEIIFLQRFTDDVEIALYSLPYSAVEMLNLFPAMLAVAAASAFATLFGAQAHDRIQRGFGRACRLTVLLTLPLTAAAITLGPDALLIAYGDDFSGTGPVLVVLLLAFPVFSLMAMSTSVVQGFGKQRAPLVALGVAAATAITLDLLLIPRFESVGAAIAHAAAQVVASVLLLAYALRLVGGIERDAGALLRLIVLSAGAAGAAIVPVLLLATVPGFLLGGLAFLCSFALLAVVLRPIPAVDAAWLGDALGNRFGPNGRRVVRAVTPRGVLA